MPGAGALLEHCAEGRHYDPGAGLRPEGRTPGLECRVSISGSSVLIGVFIIKLLKVLTAGLSRMAGIEGQTHRW